MAERSVTVRLGANVSAFQTAMKQAASSVKDLTDETSKVSQSSAWNNVANASLMAGGAILAGVGMAVKAYADFDAQMHAVAATGAEAKASQDQLRDAALRAGADTVFSAKEAAQGIEELAKAGMSTKDILGGGLRGALDLAAAGAISVSEAAETTAKTMTQFNLHGDKASHVADLLAAGAGKAVGGVHDMGMAMAQSGTVAAQYGISVEETTGVLALFAQNALLGSDAGTALKTMLLKLGNPSKEAAAAMQDLGISAYDTNGKFVGLQDLAGQLQTKMAGLTQQQRDQAMATIFGSDAIRAANILFKEGADGVSKWTKDVNDAGYAQRTAAERMNNLRGDIEKLSGAWETAMIKMGGSANGPLRDVVKGLTDLVNKVGDMSAGSQAMMLWGSAIAGGALVAVGGLMKGITAVSEFSAAMKALDVVGTLGSFKSGFMDANAAASAFSGRAGTLGGQLSSLTGGFTGLMVGVAVFAALTAATALYQQSIDRQLMSTQELSNAMHSMAASGTGLDKVNADIQHMNLTVKDLGGAFDYLSGKGDWVDRMGSSMGKAVPNILVAKSGYTQLAEEVDKVDKALAGMSSQEAAAGFNQIIKQTGKSAQEVAPLLNDYAAKLQQQAVALTGNQVSAAEMADWMGGKVPAAIQQAAAASQSADPAIKSLATSTQGAGAAAQQAASPIQELAAKQDALKKSSDALIQVMQAQGNALLAASGSAIGVEAAIASTTATIQQNGIVVDQNTQKVNLQTEAGRASQQALNDLASASMKRIEVLTQQSASEETITAETARAREQFVALAGQMGYNSQTANAMANAFFTTGAQAQTAAQKAHDLTARLNEIPPLKRAEIQALIDRGSFAAAEEAINRASRDRWSTVHVRYDDPGRPAHGINQALATGGPVRGFSPTWTSDNIPIWATAGEYMMRVAAVNRYGVHTMDAINQGLVDPLALRRAVRGYATGGEIQQQRRYYTPGQAARPAMVPGGYSTNPGTTIYYQPQISEHLSALREWEQFYGTVAKELY